MVDIEKYLEELEREVKSSSNLRLTRELIRWKLEDHVDEIEMIISELLSRESVDQLLKRLYWICLVYANPSTSFSEHFYVFDEDEKEVRRQLKIGWQAHLSVLLITLVLGAYYPLAGLILFLGYLGFTIKWSIDWYKPIAEKIKNYHQHSV
ncbi:MAG: hypothetical protein WBG42_07140 [Cryomorphaceae bacterium]